MSNLTPNLKLFKYDPVADAKQPFSITKAWNDNWDIIDKNAGGVPIGFIYPAVLGIDESDNKYRYLNGQILIQDQYVNFTSWVKSRMNNASSAFCTEEEWQEIVTNSKLGQCGKFVVDDTNGTIRLPKVINIQGLTDLANCGLIKDETLPNVKGQFPVDYMTYVSTVTNPFTYEQVTGVGIGGGSYSTSVGNMTMDLNNSSSTYQDDAPVQQEAIQYPYVICVNSGVEEAEKPISNYQVNNVYSFGMSQYYKGTMNNASWLRSEGQWNAGTVYTDLYTWILQKYRDNRKQLYGWSLSDGTGSVYTESVNPAIGDYVYGDNPLNKKWGVITSVTDTTIIYSNLKGATNVTKNRNTDIDGLYYTYDMDNINVISKNTLENGNYSSGNFTDYDYIVDEETQTFRLPLKNGLESLPGDEYTSFNVTTINQMFKATHNGYVTVLKQVSATGQFLAARAYTTKGESDSDIKYSQEVRSGGKNNLAVTIFVKRGDKYNIGWSTNDTITDITWARFTPAIGNGSLYYYVGDTLQNVDIMNVARIEETLVDKTDKSMSAHCAMPSNKYINLTLGATGATYIAPADGFYYLSKRPTSNNQYLVIAQYTEGIAGLASRRNSYQTNVAELVWIPVKKGDSVTINYTFGGTTDRFQFIYAEGAK